MYAIYGNMDPINIPPMLAYIPAPWILWVLNQDLGGTIEGERVRMCLGRSTVFRLGLSWGPSIASGKLHVWGLMMMSFLEWSVVTKCY